VALTDLPGIVEPGDQRYQGQAERVRDAWRTAGEAGALLRDVTAQQEAVAKALAQFDAEVAAAAASQPALLETPAAREQIARMAAARAASAGRAGAARQLADLLRVAQAMAGEDPGQWAP